MAQIQPHTHTFDQNLLHFMQKRYIMDRNHCVPSDVHYGKGALLLPFRVGHDWPAFWLVFCKKMAGIHACPPT